MFLNLLFKSLKTDNNLERVKSFIRRFIQVLVSGGAGGTEFVVGGLYLLGKVSAVHIHRSHLFILSRFSALFRLCMRSCKPRQSHQKQKITIPENEIPSFHMHRLPPYMNLCVVFDRSLSTAEPVILSSHFFIITIRPFPFIHASCLRHSLLHRAQTSRSTRSPIFSIGSYTRTPKSRNQKARARCNPLQVQLMVLVSSA